MERQESLQEEGPALTDRSPGAGRSFLRRLIDLSMTAKHLDHYIRLGLEARADIEWWAHFAGAWNGISMMQAGSRANPAATVMSDASGNWGCGAFSGGHWFMFKWTGPHYHITVNEMLPIVMAAALWGLAWRSKTVLFLCVQL